jgi:lipoate-protein ligase A
VESSAASDRSVATEPRRVELKTLRLIWDGPADGAWNMALDEALLESADAEGIATLRFYGWSEPTLSLGYFQAAEDRRTHAASLNCRLVRRASGGGAILHDDELTYSLSIPTPDRLAAPARGLHDSVHAALAESLIAMGVDAEFNDRAQSAVNAPFLCFERRACGDLILGGKTSGSAKVVGSAQRRHRNAVLQHGSILLGRSQFAPELPGIAELTGRRIDARALTETFYRNLCRCLSFEFDDSLASVSSVTPSILDRARVVAAEKFANEAWTFRR